MPLLRTRVSIVIVICHSAKEEEDKEREQKHIFNNNNDNNNNNNIMPGWRCKSGSGMTVMAMNQADINGVRRPVQEYCKRLRSKGGGEAEGYDNNNNNNNNDNEEADADLRNVRQVMSSMRPSEVMALMDSIRDNPVVQSLHLFRQTLLDDASWGQALHRLAPARFLLQLKLNSNGIGNEGVTAIADILANEDVLQTLVLDHNQVGDAGAVVLGKSLHTNRSLQHLWLDDNLIGDEGAKAIAQGLSHNGDTVLHLLTMEKNRIGNDGASALGQLLETNETLRVLWLGYNHIDDTGCGFLAQGLAASRSLEGLSLFGNRVGDEGCGELGQALTCNDTLQRLWLSHNRIGDRGAIRLATALAHDCNTRLRSLSLEFNLLQPIGIQALSDAVRTNSTLHTVAIAFNPHNNNNTASWKKNHNNSTYVMEYCLYRNRTGIQQFVLQPISPAWPLLVHHVLHKDNGLDLCYYILTNRPDVFRRR